MAEKATVLSLIPPANTVALAAANLLGLHAPTANTAPAMNPTRLGLTAPSNNVQPHTSATVGLFGAPLLGSNVVYPSFTINLGSSRCTVVEAPATNSGAVESLRVYVLSLSKFTTGVRLGILSDVLGTPGSLLGEGVATPALGWVEAVLSPGVLVTAGTAYWLAVLPVGGRIEVPVQGGSGEFWREDEESVSTIAEAAASPHWSSPFGAAPFSLFGTATPKATKPSATVNIVGEES